MARHGSQPVVAALALAFAGEQGAGRARGALARADRRQPAPYARARQAKAGQLKPS
jgi:hypothetical protein